MKVVYSDEERAIAKDAGMMLFAFDVRLPENKADQGTNRTGTLTRDQADDLIDLVLGFLRKIKTAG